MYKIGDKVETPHGTGWVRGYSEVYDMYIVDLKGAFKKHQRKNKTMYEQYVMIEKRLLNNKSRLVIVENELEKLISKTNMKYVSPSFDNVT